MNRHSLPLVALFLSTLAACSSAPGESGTDEGAVQLSEAPAPAATRPEVVQPIREGVRSELERIARVETPESPQGVCGNVRVVTLGPPSDVPEAEGLQPYVLRDGKAHELMVRIEVLPKCKSATMLDLSDDDFDLTQPHDECTSALCKELLTLEKSFFVDVGQDSFARVIDTVATLEHFYVNPSNLEGKSALFAIPKKGLGAITEARAIPQGVRITGAKGSLDVTVAGAQATVVRR